MKFSLKLASHIARSYKTGVDPATYPVNELIERLGLQLGAVESIDRVADRYDGVSVAKITSCSAHPDADKLQVCKIDDGGVTRNVERDNNGLINVVCGAPNAREGLLVAWIPPGAAVPISFKTEAEPFVLTPKEIRGVVSNGMLASPHELDLSEEHGGILEIDPNDVGHELAFPGVEFSRLYGLDDVIVDLENKMFTHRPDCFGVLGVAREVAGIFGDTFTSPKWYTDYEPLDEESSLPLSARNEVPELVSRFTIRAMSDVEVSQSPMWLQVYLRKIGQKSINNIVDYTNFFMTETAQPLHAFDYDKVAALCDKEVVLFPRHAKKGEKLSLLNGKIIELHEADIVIATDKKAIALAGVMGGSETEVDGSTQNIIIEGANFDMYAIRRTSMRHGLFTDAVTRFNKGQSPLQNDRVIEKMVAEVQQFAGGKVASSVLDIANFNADADNRTRVELSSRFINSRLGSQLSGAEIKKLLENVEFVVAVDDIGKSESAEYDAQLIVTAPFWRMDIALKEDIVEEVGRLYGYDKLPVSLPNRSSRPAARNDRRLYKQNIRELMTRRGGSEVLTYSFVHGKLMQHTGVDPEKWAYHLRNALSPELQYYRTALLPSLLAKVHQNLKAGAGTDDNQFVIYELGSVHVKDHMSEHEPELPSQMHRMAAVFAADDKTAAARYEGSAYFHAKAYIDALTQGQAVYEPLENTEYPITAAYQVGRAATVTVNEQILGVVGELHSKARAGFKLPSFCAGFELDTELLRQHVQEKSYTALSAFPSTQQSITLKVPATYSWKRVYDFVHAELAVAAAEDGYHYKLRTTDIYQPESSEFTSYTFGIELTHPHKTLKTTELTTLLDHIAKQAARTLDAQAG